MAQRVSLCLIVKNEEATLAECLQSVAGLVHETIVVDTGSTDGTRAIAAKLGARAFDFNWVDSFSAARNASLEPATGDWILWLDGDEYFDAENRAKLKALVEGLRDEPAAYIMRQRSASEVPGEPPTLVDQCRLFRNHPQIRWSYRVHEQILPAVNAARHQVRFIDICIDHSGYTDPAIRARKSERNLRLLHLDEAEQPNEPFTLFNLGWIYMEHHQPARAVPYLRRSLEQCGRGDSIVRKLFFLLSLAHEQQGQIPEALRWCRAGRARCPDDAELLFHEGLLLRRLNDRAGAKAAWRALVEVRPGHHFASVEAGIRGYKPRYQLALLYRDEGNVAEAEVQWRAVVAERPNFYPAWAELAELCLAQGRWNEFDEAVARLPHEGSHAHATLVLCARGLLARRQHGAARQLLDQAIALAPRDLVARQLLTRALLDEGRDPAAMEQSLRDLLRLEPCLAEAWRNLAAVVNNQGRLPEAIGICQAGRQHCPQDADLLLQLGMFLSDARDHRAAEPLLLQYVESQPVGGGAAGICRHRLALIYQQRGWPREAEAQWRALLADQPTFAGALLGLAEIFLAQRRWEELEEVAGRVNALPDPGGEAGVLQARIHRARGERSAALALLEQTIARHPQAVWPRLVRTHWLIDDGVIDETLEQALREVLVLDPQHTEARQNLAVYLARRNGPAEGPLVPIEVLHGPGPARPMPEPNGAPEPPPPAATPDQPVFRLAPRKCLRLAFATYCPVPVRTATAYERPLGGSESALCYLAEALAARGHEVFLLSSTPAPEVSRGVPCLPLTPAMLGQLPALDAFVVQNLAGQARPLRQALGPKTRLILWTQHTHDQPAVQPLRDPAERNTYDALVFVSDWQRAMYREHLGIDPRRTAVRRNGIGPAFQRLFTAEEAILAAKSRPPVLAYTSTPYRGLDRLLTAFPRIRAAVPGVTLQVFSSMQVYGIAGAEDQERFGKLYQLCRETEGVDYVGSVPQPELARRLRAATVLAYPNTFPETSCIAVLEAMAAGCRVVTSELGALPETAGGFANLIPTGNGWDAYLNRFVEEMATVLANLDGDAEDHLRRQVAHVNQCCTWAGLADEWVQWLSR